MLVVPSWKAFSRTTIVKLLHMVGEFVRRNPQFRNVRSLGKLNELCTVVDGCVSQSMIYNLPWKGLSGMADYSFSKTDK